MGILKASMPGLSDPARIDESGGAGRTYQPAPRTAEQQQLIHCQGGHDQSEDQDPEVASKQQ